MKRKPNLGELAGMLMGMSVGVIMGLGIGTLGKPGATNWGWFLAFSFALVSVVLGIIHEKRRRTIPGGENLAA